MDRRAVEVVLLAVFAIVAIAAAAATLPTATTGGAGAGGGPQRHGPGTIGPRPAPVRPLAPALDLSFLRPLLLALLLLVVVGLAVYGYLYRRDVLRGLLVFGVLVALIALIGWFFGPGRSTAPVLPVGGEPFSLPGGGNGGPTDPSLPLGVLAILVALLVAGGLLLRRRQRDSTTEASRPGANEVADVGRAAGRAADQLERAGDTENAVYRAWREMTDLLEVDRPSTSTSGEFADAAIAAGMAPADVTELTRLFEDVRYGEDEATPASERRALAVLRRIEATYAPAEADA